MKCLLINLIVFVIVVNSDVGKRLFLPHLPLGEYRVNFLAVLRCDLKQLNEKIQFNFRLSKTSANTTEINGNLTNTVPIDDSFNMEVDMAVKDSIGGWKENAHLFKTPKACSSFKTFLGDTFRQAMDKFGAYNITGCPIPPGIYILSHYNTDRGIYLFPKKFFYGPYKWRFRYTKNNEQYGCKIFVIEIKRPWETD